MAQVLRISFWFTAILTLLGVWIYMCAMTVLMLPSVLGGVLGLFLFSLTVGTVVHLVTKLERY